MEIFVIGRFHAPQGQENALKEAVIEVTGPSRDEAGCLFFQAYQSNRDSGLIYIHSRWADQAAFETHASLSHTKRFLDKARGLMDQPVDITAAGAIG